MSFRIEYADSYEYTDNTNLFETKTDHKLENKSEHAPIDTIQLLLEKTANDELQRLQLKHSSENTNRSTGPTSDLTPLIPLATEPYYGNGTDHTSQSVALGIQIDGPIPLQLQTETIHSNQLNGEHISVPVEEKLIRGEKGDKGELGLKGDIGEKGDKGEKGDRGEKGEKGDHGEKGDVGGKGDKGDKGDVGDKGEKGEKGDVGDTKGDKGDVGEKGDKGDVGDNGNNGDNGEKGEKGDKGDKGDVGEKGDIGEKGDKGEKGNVGPKGQPCMYVNGEEKRMVIFPFHTTIRSVQVFTHETVDEPVKLNLYYNNELVPTTIPSENKEDTPTTQHDLVNVSLYPTIKCSKTPYLVMVESNCNIMGLIVEM